MVFRKPRQLYWTDNLEWFATRVQPRDFLAFDYAIVGADERTHSQFAQRPELMPVTTSGSWRLYRVRGAAR